MPIEKAARAQRARPAAAASTKPAAKSTAKPAPKSAAKPAPKAAASPAAPAGARANKLAPVKEPRDVKVVVDGRLKGLWDSTLDVIRKAKGQGAEAFDELWEAVARVVEHDPPLYVLGGFGSSGEFFEQVLQEKERTARRFMRVAKYASPHEEAKYGTTVLDAALGFVEATAGGPLSGPLPIAFERLRIPVTRNGKDARVPLEKATAEEIAKATRAVMQKNGKARSAPNPIEEALTKALSAHGETKSVRATVRGGTATFSNVSVASIQAFARALAGAKLPAAEERASATGSRGKVAPAKRKATK